MNIFLHISLLETVLLFFRYRLAHSQYIEYNYTLIELYFPMFHVFYCIQFFFLSY